MKMRKLACLLIVTQIISGCATHYTCGDVPDSKCQNISDVYNNNPSYSHSHKKDPDDLQVNQKSYVLQKVKPEKPLLSKPIVLRVLLNSWIDSEGDFDGGGYLYIKVKDAEWNLN